MEVADGRSGKVRHPAGFSGLIEKVLLIAIPSVGILFIMNFHFYLGLDIYREQYLAIFLGLVLIGVFLAVPATKTASRTHVPWYDLLMAGMGAGISIYSCAIYPEYLMSGPLYVGPFTPVLGVLIILLIAEATRRTIKTPRTGVNGPT